MLSFYSYLSYTILLFLFILYYPFISINPILTFYSYLSYSILLFLFIHTLLSYSALSNNFI